ncbi:unnamed protein product [Lactuca saligna]|uniref:Uncharacterized protein n=1 Tax=Lactuca saligna TaxID=75948 RepID=A0AA35VL00_LACSI|nr:unnamed protein product [Lactuca saligna]
MMKNSSDEDGEKDKGCMAHIDTIVTIEGSSGSSTFKAELAKAAKDSKLQNWDSSSLYQVNKFVTYSDNKKYMMFDYLFLHHSKVTNLSLTNVDLHTKKDKSELHTSYKVVNIYKQIETEPNCLSLSDLREDFKSMFAINSFINHSLTDKNYTTNTDGVTVYTTRLTALDLPDRNLALNIPTPTIEMYLKFPISDGEFHSTHEILSNSCNNPKILNPTKPKP